MEDLLMPKIIFTIFIFILIFSPLAFGTVEPWSLTIMETFSIFSLFLLLIRNLKYKDTFLYEIPGIIPLTLFLAYILIQLIPLPSGIIKVISPETYNLYKETILINEPLTWVSLSINKKATLMEFFRITAYVAFYILTMQLLTKKDILKKTIAVIIAFASLLSFLGILQHILSNNKIFWFRELTQGGTPFGPYVNRNHYAGLMEMLFPLVLSLFLFYKPHVTYNSFREKITEIFNRKRTNIYILLGFAAILIGTSIFLSLSRSGIVSLCLSMIIFGVMFIAKGTNRKRGIIIIIIFILIVLSVGWFGWGPIFERFERVKNAQGDISELRIEIWKDSRNIIRDFPVIGTGFGSFINIYPKYRTISGDGIADHAHNDYIELFSDGGAIAFLISVCFLLTLLYKSYRAFLKRHEIYSIYLFIGSIAGMLSILIHSITDFNLHIGANGLYFFFLLGLVVSAANTRLRDEFNDTYLKKIKFPIRMLTIPVAVILFVSLIFNTGVIIGKLYFSSIKDIKLNEKISKEDLVSIRVKAYRASLFDPLEARYHYAVANTERLLSNNAIALSHYKKSVHLNPVNGEYLQRLGLTMSELKKYDTADKLLQTGIKYDISKPAGYKRYALWLLSHGKKEDGIRIMKTAISLEPQKTKEYITLMILNKLSDEEIFSSLPERVGPHLLFADYLSKTGREKMAEDAYLSALQYIKNEDPINPSYFYEVYRYYMKKNRYDEALKIMRKAIEFRPDDAGIRITTAGLYEKLGITYRAVEEYKKALLIDPKNDEAKKRLDNLMSKIKG
jgi:O-antigen ligase/tetratricopeptide (TPR) repeat protein